MRRPPTLCGCPTVVNKCGVYRCQSKARVAIGAALKLPPTVVKTLALPKVTTRITPDQVAFWIDVMNRQNMLKNKPDPTMLIWP